jgi:type IV secretion system protein VirB11
MNDSVPDVDVAMLDRSRSVRSLLAACGITPFLSAPGVTEISINRPGEFWTESCEGWVRHDAPGCTLDRLMKLANTLTIYNRATPPLSAADPIKPVRLPDGQRGQVVIPPACEPDTVSITIRMPSTQRFSLEQLVAQGRLDGYQLMSPVPTPDEAAWLSDDQRVLLEVLTARDIGRFLALAIAHRLNLVLVGGTGSGKTTLMKTLADLVPADVRVATIEDTHELPLPQQPNRVHLFYSDVLPARELVKATLRMKFDRVYLAELRGDETWDYLTLLNTAHRGGMTTVHANDCMSAFARVATLIKQSPVGQTLDYADLLREVKTTIDVVLFMDKYRLTQVYYDPVEKLRLQRGIK